MLLDGLLKAPRTYENQETITKGDEKEAAIALASIVAKVHRDRHMRRLAKKHPEYSFEEHKGYGTKKHYKLLKKYGPSEVHRKTFLRRLGLNEMTEGEAIEAVLQAERELTLSGKNLDTFARELEE